MKALAIVKGKDGIQEIDIEEPKIEDAKQVKIKIIEMGIDGTDRSILKHSLLDPPEGEDYLILGHEAVGEVIEVGDKVKEIKLGDSVVPTVRRGCNQCASCLHNQSDMCSTGLYKERGIHKLHGYFTEYVVEEEKYLVKIPENVQNLAVLTEPLSIAEKALEEVRFIQQRLPWACIHPEHTYNTPGWGGCKKAMVIGVGPLGFLAVALLRYYGLPTYALVNRDRDDIRVRLIEQMGAIYVDSRNINLKKLLEKTGHVDLIIEASGVAPLILDLIPLLSRNGIFVLTGIPRGERKVCLDGNLIIRETVRKNQIILGSVNSNKSHFESAVKHLYELREMYGNVINKIITKRYSLKDYKEAFEERKKEDLKTIFDMKGN
ncbi:MAG: glucose 1-dehydrogenase [Actinomycetia bacterium]|nr:glucose 1-dehydrogenase [Actinomycetes bacterium]